MVRMKHRHALAASLALLFTAGAARADEAPAAPPDSLPGSAVPWGLGLSPETPPVATAPGGRAPSFGAPEKPAQQSFRIGGRFYGWEAVGIGRRPTATPDGYSGTPLHMPALSTGKIPFWGGAGATFTLQYTLGRVTALATYYTRINRPEYQGYANPVNGPGFGMAYLEYKPDPLGALRLTFRVGGFLKIYAGPGQWGWGIFGPLLAVRGYGENSEGEWDLNKDVRLSFEHGVLINRGVPERFPRGDYNGWIETGVSSWVNHAHLGMVYRNQYTLKLHYASARGTDERVYLNTALGTPPHDGRMDVYLGEARWQGTTWGQAAIAGGIYDFTRAASVADGIWWGVDWTQGAKDMMNKFIGPASGGNGRVAVIGTEYNFSIAPILWHPRSFTGNAPDLRISIAAMLTRTLATDDPQYKQAMGYYFGLDTEYRMTANFSMTFQSYGESRDSKLGEWSVYSVNPGIKLRTDWNSMDAIQLIYSRRWYSHAADPNSALPFDRHMIALGGYITF